MAEPRPGIVVVAEPLLVGSALAGRLVGLIARAWQRLASSGAVPDPVRLGSRRLWRMSAYRGAPAVTNHTESVPNLITPGVIAKRLGAPLHRVVHVLRTRSHIRPSARAGTLRLYSNEVLAAVRHELNAIDARRPGR